MHDVKCEVACAVTMRSSNGRERPNGLRTSFHITDPLSFFFQISSPSALFYIQCECTSSFLGILKKDWKGLKKGLFTITAEIHARSLAEFYGEYADRHMNLKFVRRVSEREREIRQSVIVEKIDVSY